jgi:hypothetical protein
MGRFVAGFVAAWTAVSFTVVCLTACAAPRVSAAAHACCKQAEDGSGARFEAVTADCCAQPHMVKPTSNAAPSATPGSALIAAANESACAGDPIAHRMLPPLPGASPPLILRI